MTEWRVWDDHVRAYWAFNETLMKVSGFKDSASRREQAMGDATYSIRLFVLSSAKIREDLTELGTRRSKQRLLRNEDDANIQGDLIYE